MNTSCPRAGVVLGMSNTPLSSVPACSVVPSARSAAISAPVNQALALPDGAPVRGTIHVPRGRSGEECRSNRRQRKHVGIRHPGVLLRPGDAVVGGAGDASVHRTGGGPSRVEIRPDHHERVDLCDREPVVGGGPGGTVVGGAEDPCIGSGIEREVRIRCETADEGGRESGIDVRPVCAVVGGAPRAEVGSPANSVVPLA